MFSGAGLRDACFHSDTTKHTASPSSFSLLSPSLVPPITSPLLLMPPVQLSPIVCLFVNTVEKLSVLVNFHPLNSLHPYLPSSSPTPPNLTLLKENYNLSVSSEKEISLQFHYLNMWKYELRHCPLTCETAAKKSKWNKMRRISLFSAWSRVCFYVSLMNKCSEFSCTTGFIAHLNRKRNQSCTLFGKTSLEWKWIKEPGQ